MEFKFRVKGKFNKPVEQVFAAVKDPEKLAQYFAEDGASAPLEANSTVVWKFDGGYEIPVTVVESVTNERIVFEWDSGDKIPTRVLMEFEALDDNRSAISISESGWPETEKGLDKSYDNCSGWTHMLCSLKVYLEHGLNLNDFY